MGKDSWRNGDMNLTLKDRMWHIVKLLAANIY